MDDEICQKNIDYIMETAESLRFMFNLLFVIKPVLQKHLVDKITKDEINLLTKELIEVIYEDHKEKE